MKHSNKLILFTVASALLLVLTMQGSAWCQPPPPPPGGGNSTTSHNLNNNQGAPVGDGVWILFMLALTYGVLQQMRVKKNSRHEDVKNLSSELVAPEIRHQQNSKYTRAVQMRKVRKLKQERTPFKKILSYYNFIYNQLINKQLNKTSQTV